MDESLESLLRQAADGVVSLEEAERGTRRALAFVGMAKRQTVEQAVLLSVAKLREPVGRLALEDVVRLRVGVEEEQKVLREPGTKLDPAERVLREILCTAKLVAANEVLQWTARPKLAVVDGSAAGEDNPTGGVEEGSPGAKETEHAG